MNWALRRSAVQRLSIKSLTHLENSLTKVLDAKQSLEIEMRELQGRLLQEGRGVAATATTTALTKTFNNGLSTPNMAPTTFQPAMTVDDEVKALCQRSKMVVLRAAMVGTGATTSGNAIESVDFDRYATQLVMLTRRLRKALHQRGAFGGGRTSTGFRWRWEDLERDLDVASKEEARALEHQAEKREKQRQRNMWRQQRYDDGSSGEPKQKEPPQVAINVPEDLRPNGNVQPLLQSQNSAVTNVSFAQQSTPQRWRDLVSVGLLFFAVCSDTVVPCWR